MFGRHHSVEHEDAAIREGFVCPNCLQDLPSAQALLDHVESMHPVSHEPVAQSHGKAAAHAEEYERPLVWPEQKLGASRSHKLAFRKKRKQRTDFNDINAHQLITRLEKLLFSGPSARATGKAGTKARKEFERSLVPWVEDALVPACPDCGLGFGMMRRRHHCRLCGAVMCSECCNIMDLKVALKLAQPPALQGSQQGGNADVESQLRVADESLRVCNYCSQQLQSTLQRKTKQSKAVQEPPVVQLYQQLKALMKEADPLLDRYNRLVHRLVSDLDMSQYEACAALRVNVLKEFEKIDTTTKKIVSINAKDADPKSDRMKVQRSIRYCAVEYLQNNMFTLQSLPKKEKLQKAADAKAKQRAEKERRRREEAAARAEQERLRREQAAAKAAASKKKRPSSQPPEIVALLEQQRQQIVGYIRQAQQAGKMDEVEMLQRQLSELELL
eukprot:m.28376 g.28376  ORF g.28376 m.28376 type:complete len:444 (+) comp8808_c0_seq2:459-1790(+)